MFAKNIFEMDPKTLTVERLNRLQGTLLTKLVQVNAELELRYRAAADFSGGIEGVDGERALMGQNADKLHDLNVVLNEAMAKRDRPPQ